MRSAARQIYDALDRGRDTVTPGVLNGLYKYVVAPVLPAPVTGALHQVGCDLW
jgi:hypothetical protein